MFNLQSKRSKDFLRCFSNCHLNSLMYSILHFQMYNNSLNGEYYTIIDFNEVDMRIYLPEKVIIHRGL